MLNGADMSDVDAGLLYDAIVLDAVKACAPAMDMDAIKAHVDRRIAALNDNERRAVERHIALACGCHEPASPPFKTS